MKTDLLDSPADETALAPASGALMFERLAADPNVPVEKLERLIAMQERIMAHNAKAEFDAAYAEMQGDIPIITERGEIAVNGQVRSKYARLEDILEIVKPIMQKHGFAIRHQSQFADGMVKITGILSHRAGHSERDEFVAAADTSGSKNAIQALGSTRSYGQRYTTIALLNIATRGTDDDGHGSAKAGKRDIEPPNGFESWWDDMRAVADEGIGKLSAAWNASKAEHRAYLVATNKAGWEALKLQAGKVRS
jgi:hypothetical protein